MSDTRKLNAAILDLLDPYPAPDPVIDAILAEMGIVEPAPEPPPEWLAAQKKALDEVNRFTSERMKRDWDECGPFTRILPPVTITDDDLDRAFLGDGPEKRPYP